MKQIDLDIFVFSNVIPNDLIIKLLSIRNKSSFDGRLDLNVEDMNVFHMFNTFWFDKIESPYLNHYFNTYNTEKGIGLNSSEDTINELKKFVETRWRDLFLLHYAPHNMNKGEKDIHWDFSGLSTVGCLNDEYEGGELVFPRQNIRYKLEKGDIIVFPGGLTHPHYVEPITNGMRDVIVGQSMTLIQNHKINY
jgi:hypothetical protein